MTTNQVLNTESKSFLFSNTVIIIIVSSVILIVLYKLLFKSKSKAASNTMLIIGPSNSGKTTFFYHLLNRKNIDTVVSMQINEIENYSSKFLNKCFSIVDVPGQGYFKETIMDRIDSAKIILLFIDSSEKSSIYSAGEFLYDIFNSDKFDYDIPLIIVCNKQDAGFPKTKKMVENELTNEIENIKQIKQKNNLDDNAQIGALFKMKTKFNFTPYSNVKFVETDKNGYKNLLAEINKIFADN